MAANDYYNDPYSSPSPAPQHHATGAYSSNQSTYSNPPPYQSQTSLNRPNAPKPSPFDTVFDDHVYPAGSNSSSANMSQNSFAQDNRYNNYSPSGHAHTPTSPADDIPLRNQSKYHGAAMNSTDHVYDVENPDPAAENSGCWEPKRGGYHSAFISSPSSKLPFSSASSSRTLSLREARFKHNHTSTP